MDLYRTTKAFSALGQETRLHILELLVKAEKDELSAGEISDALGVPQNTLSFHLNHMEAAGVANRRRAGRYILYSAHSDGMRDILKYLLENCVRQG